MRLRQREYAAALKGDHRRFYLLEPGTQIRELRQYRGWATFDAFVGERWQRYSVLGRVRVR